MKNDKINLDKKITDNTEEETLNLIAHHKEVAKHYEDAAKHRRDAAMFHEAGFHNKAFQSIIKSNGHAFLASEALRTETNKQSFIS